MLTHSLNMKLDRFPDELYRFFLGFTGSHAARKIRNVGAESSRCPVQEDRESHEYPPPFKANPPAFHMDNGFTGIAIHLPAPEGTFVSFNSVAFTCTLGSFVRNDSIPAAVTFGPETTRVSHGV
jgi:hypothetical protein